MDGRMVEGRMEIDYKWWLADSLMVDSLADG